MFVLFRLFDSFSFANQTERRINFKKYYLSRKRPVLFRQANGWFFSQIVGIFSELFYNDNNRFEKKEKWWLSGCVPSLRLKIFHPFAVTSFKKHSPSEMPVIKYKFTLHVCICMNEPEWSGVCLYIIDTYLCDRPFIYSHMNVCMFCSYSFVKIFSSSKVNLNRHGFVRFCWIIKRTKKNQY